MDLKTTYGSFKGPFSPPLADNHNSAKPLNMKGELLGLKVKSDAVLVSKEFLVW